MEYEVRFYFSKSEKENIINKLNNIKDLNIDFVRLEVNSYEN